MHTYTKKFSVNLSARLLIFLLSLIPKNLFSRFFGLLSRCYLPLGIRHVVLYSYSRLFRINTHEAEKPLFSYTSLNAFFTRKLKKQARKIDFGENKLLSPVDGKILAQGRLSEGKILQIKNISYHVKELLPEAEDLSQFRQGRFITIYLSPADYHRIHTPCNCSLDACYYDPGLLWPVNKAGMRFIPGLLSRNERLSSRLEFRWQGSSYPLYLVMVGAFNVGHIKMDLPELASFAPAHKGTNRNWLGKASAQSIQLSDKLTLKQGAPLATFHMGSTVVLLFPEDLSLEFYCKMGERVQMGEKIASLR